MKQLDEKRWFNQFGQESKSEAPIHVAAGRRLLASLGGRAMRGFRGSASAALQGSESGRRPPSSELVPLID
jgi:hypothetical protein